MTFYQRVTPLLTLIFLFGNVVLDASFSENFYGLRRVTCDGSQHVTSKRSATGRTIADDAQIVGSEVRHLTRTERRRSLFFLVSIILQLVVEYDWLIKGAVLLQSINSVCVYLWVIDH